jgi:hypothetical protein
LALPIALALDHNPARSVINFINGHTAFQLINAILSQLAAHPNPITPIQAPFFQAVGYRRCIGQQQQTLGLVIQAPNTHQRSFGQLGAHGIKNRGASLRVKACHQFAHRFIINPHFWWGRQQQIHAIQGNGFKLSRIKFCCHNTINSDSAHFNGVLGLTT